MISASQQKPFIPAINHFAKLLYCNWWQYMWNKMLQLSLSDFNLWFHIIGSEPTGLSCTVLSMALWSSECLYCALFENTYLRTHGTAIKETHSDDGGYYAVSHLKSSLQEKSLWKNRWKHEYLCGFVWVRIFNEGSRNFFICLFCRFYFPISCMCFLHNINTNLWVTHILVCITTFSVWNRRESLHIIRHTQSSNLYFSPLSFWKGGWDTCTRSLTQKLFWKSSVCGAWHAPQSI